MSVFNMQIFRYMIKKNKIRNKNICFQVDITLIKRKYEKNNL